MSLEPGARLGPYTIVAPLGSGGMGEGYRAHDTTLGRDVAVKILPHHFSSDGDRLSRFRREAQLLAAINHPGIASIYGVEESDGVSALVLELVEGPTLADRIARGALQDVHRELGLEPARGLANYRHPQLARPLTARSVSSYG